LGASVLSHVLLDLPRPQRCLSVRMTLQLASTRKKVGLSVEYTKG